jgi:hypothetical protein
MKPPEKLIKYSHETSVVILLIILIVIGVSYNIIEKRSLTPDLTLCPLCSDSVIYYQNEGVKLPDETVTF